MDGPMRLRIPFGTLRRHPIRLMPAWPAGWRALIWQTVLRLSLAGLILAVIATVWPLPSVPQPPRPLATPAGLAWSLPLPTRTRSPVLILTQDPFRADRRFPPVAIAPTHGGLPKHWGLLPRQHDRRLLLFGVAGSTGHLKALVGTVTHESWLLVGAFLDQWQLVAIRPHRVLWRQNGAYAVSAIISIHEPQTERPPPIALFARGAP